MARPGWLDAQRSAAWRIGIEHRESLLSKYLRIFPHPERPFLKDVIDDMIEEVQGARLRTDVLPLDTFAQTEAVRGRLEVTVNTRIAEMPGVKDAAGVACVAKWHESIHVDRDLSPQVSRARKYQMGLPGLEDWAPRLVVCRRLPGGRGGDAELEFIAENAAIAAAIAGPDLARCPTFQEFMALARGGGPLPQYAWPLLYQTAAFIGVNISALVKYGGYRGWFRVEALGGRNRIFAAPPLFEESMWL